jgi:thiamine biosynthesis protein ThiS
LGHVVPWLRRVFEHEHEHEHEGEEEIVMSTVTVNGKPHDLAPGATVADLIHSLGRDPARIFAEVNGDVVLPAEYECHRLHDGDRVELLAFVGGG